MANEAGDVIAGLYYPLEGIAGCQILMLKARSDLPSLTYVSSVISRKRTKQHKKSDKHFQNKDSVLKHKLHSILYKSVENTTIHSYLAYYNRYPKHMGPWSQVTLRRYQGYVGPWSQMRR